ncbi:hypothetical protein GCM10009083_22650 [Halopseudomonas pertucinogena]|uniref:Uncharacterized protein n=1 Tax=Halopseudomonas pertucinogena TaxID=86175 RepID=A0ABQ2CR89_9GAMM|nr:hypothetical protein GCM10009083_22650 [Halopseudomonas pertucinogena]
MVEKVVVLGSQQGVDEPLGNLLEADGQATHFTEFGDQLVIFAVNAQRGLQFDIAQCIYIWKAGAEGQGNAAKDEQRTTCCGNQQPEKNN